MAMDKQQVEGSSHRETVGMCITDSPALYKFTPIFFVLFAILFISQCDV